MPTVRIYDLDGDNLAAHLGDLIEVLGAPALKASWTIAPVSAAQPEFEAAGRGGKKLEALADARATVSGLELSAIARDTMQVIWGQFTAQRPETSDGPWVSVRFVDSTFCEITSADDAVLEAIRARFRDVRAT